MIEWFTTNPNPRVVDYTADAGQRGWKLHAMEMTEEETKMPIHVGTAYVYQDGERSRGGRRALCGLAPMYGWGMDLFISDKCKRCEAIIKKR